MRYYSWIEESPFRLRVVMDDTSGLVACEFAGRGVVSPEDTRDDRRCAEAGRQLREYFRGERRSFQLPLSPRGTPFQMEVWRELLRIPFGERITYSELAARVGRPAAVRAVGHANGHNPIAVIIPCHRVVGRDGSLTGYGGGIERKRWLLELEAK